MHIAYVNPNEPKKAVEYLCSVCGLYFGWRDESSYYEKSVGEGCYGYEKQFVMCSEKCHTEAVERGLIDKFFKNNKKH